MKKNLIIALFILLLTVSVPISANQTSLGSTIKSDIIAYINGYPIECFSYQDKILVFIDDLPSYGFHVSGHIGDGEKVNITVNTGFYQGDKFYYADKKIDVAKGYFRYSYKNYLDYITRWQYNLGTNLYRITGKSELVYINNESVESYYVSKPHYQSGWAIFIKDLNKLGEVIWVSEQRAVKLWINEKEFNDTFVIPHIEKKLTTEVAVEYLNNYNKINKVQNLPSDCLASMTNYGLKDEHGDYIEIFTYDKIFKVVNKYKVYSDRYVDDMGSIGYIKNNKLIYY